MISNRLLQESLEDFKEIVRLPMALYDRNCTCVAGAENMAPEKEVFQTFCNSSADMQALGNRYLFRVGDGESGYILSVSGDEKDTYPMGRLAVRQLERILEIGYSREDRNQFIHNLLLDNLMPVDIANYARQMHIGPECRWGVFLVEGKECEAFDIQNILKSVPEIRNTDFIASMEEDCVAVIRRLENIPIWPATHYVTPREKRDAAVQEIYRELDERVAFFEKNNQLVEAQRLKQRTMYDVEMMQELGYCSGIENYSRVIEGRPVGSPPHTLLDYFPKDFVLFIDESHVTLPQVRAMYNGDRARKTTLVDYGFRLPCAYDNRPLKFEEFEQRVNQVVYVSATPGEYERTRSGQIVEQVIRPTGLLDPEIQVRPVEGQIDDLIGEINARTARNERVLVTTLTKRMAEDLTAYLQGAGIKVRYMHHDIDAMERMEIIRDLRLGTFHVLIGINLLREGLDLPEVSLVAILDADKEGFLRSETALIQTIGRAARNAGGQVIMYADSITPSMQRAMDETQRRREKQAAYNREHGIVPKTVIKSVRDLLDISAQSDETDSQARKGSAPALTKQQKTAKIAALEKQMKEAAKMLEFELAAALRDQIIELRGK